MEPVRVRGSLFAPLVRCAWVALMVLAIGGASHLAHHLADADCERVAEGAPHACAACAAFHGGLLAGASQPLPAPAPRSDSHFIVHPIAIQDTHAASVGPPRGPPTA